MTNQKETAEWRPVKGYEGRYEVSNQGQIRSLPRPTVNWIDSQKEPRILSQTKGKHITASLYKDGLLKVARVHRVVAEAFLPNPYCKTDVKHIDGDKRNNRASNLEWATRKENFENQRKLGLRAKKISPQRKADPEEVRRLYVVGIGQAGMTQAQIAAELGIAQSRVSVILSKAPAKEDTD